MSQPSLLQTRSDGRLRKFQIRSLKGLRERVTQLKRSWESDKYELEEVIEHKKREFETQCGLQAESQWQILHSNVEAWDVELDQHTAYVEREFLYSVQFEKSEVDRYRSKLAKDKLSSKKRFEETLERLKRELEANIESAQKTRDSVKAKLTNEKRLLEQVIQDVRDWILIKTGRDLLSEDIRSTSTPDTSEQPDLQALARRIEESKKSLQSTIEGAKRDRRVKWFSSIAFYSLGVLIALMAAGIAWFLKTPPLIVGGIVVIGSICCSAILHFATRPLVAHAVRQKVANIKEDITICEQNIMRGYGLADNFYQSEQQRLSSQCKTDTEEADEAYRKRKRKLQDDFEQACENLKLSCAQQRYDLSTSRRTKHEAINGTWEPAWFKLKAKQKDETEQFKSSHEKTIDDLRNEFGMSQRYRVARWSEGQESAVAAMRVVAEHFQRTQPDWHDSFYERPWPRDPGALLWRMGTTQATKPLNKEVSSCDESLVAKPFDWPIAYDLMGDGAMILHCQSGTENLSDQVMQNVCLRAVTALPAGSLQMTIIDPQGLGKTFSWLMSIADENPSLVGDRVWTQPLHIADQLARAARHVEDVIQQSLRNNYKNLYEYNQQAGPMAIPYRLIVWDHFPFGLDDHSWQSLCSILAAGGRCGVGVILRISENHVWPTFADPAKLRDFGLHLRFERAFDSQGRDDGTRVFLNIPELSTVPMYPDAAPTADRVREIIEHHLEAVSDIGKMIVPFESIEIPVKERQVTSSAEGLAIPVGISAAGRLQQLRLGQGTSQHVLIAGKTGSGKSSLLHTMITSAAMKYSPDDLRLILLDFKKGVEFQVYAEAELSHTDIIGIESRREFGVSTLEYLDRVMHARGEAFREWGVQDLPSLARRKPDIKMPRILIVIDEFQELFVEDDKLSQQASMLMDRIVRQGRSFGMHLVLASQTLGGAYSLPRTTLAQMAVRIALQCDSSDAMLILSEDNTAAERLRHSGQAIYNEAGGRIESNQGFQVSFLTKESQLERLHSLSKVPVPHDPTTNALGRRVVFEGHKPAIWDERSIALAMAGSPSSEGGYAMILGESVAIDPPIIKPVHRGAGRNCFVVGTDESMAASILAGCLVGFQRTATTPTLPTAEIRILNGARPEDVTLGRFLSSLDGLQNTVLASPREIESFMGELQNELESRLSQAEVTHPSKLICICNLSRFRELRKSEDFAFGDDSGGTKPDSVLANLLKDGPTVGLYVWVWADTAGTLTRWMSRQSLRDVELRILMQMSSNDSNQLIDSNAANRLEAHVALVQDDVDGKPVKFRPFDLESVTIGRIEKES
jgi:DNA segregation ATPase FtsK/SpoIIIE, S-DNA-T family